MTQKTDFLIVGGGIVGLATAMRLGERFPGRQIMVVEKENEVASHQTGHNSGVIHAGVYYAPGSLKAEFCRRGVQETIDFCTRHQIAFEQCGKLLVATTPLELERMGALFERCVQNGLKPVRLDAESLARAEPNISGLGALFVNVTGIVDYVAMARKMAQIVTDRGGVVITGTRVTGIVEDRDHVEVHTNRTSFETDHLIVCGGLQADRLAMMAGLDIDFRIVPFRGEYYRLRRHLNDVVKHLIYPIPDPDLPFLGVHLTRMIDGSVTVGPNAVLGFAREGYSKLDVNLKDIWDMLRYGGFWKVMRENWRSGLDEFRNSISKRRYLELCRKYCPQLTLKDLEPYPAGIRAQAVMNDGTLVHDFLIKQTPRMLHVCNAPSPAATSSIPIADHLVHLISDERKPNRRQPGDRNGGQFPQATR
ncbi:MAG: L-2-hydroxyglutarate oxidase [Pseudomonadota bacterium]